MKTQSIHSTTSAAGSPSRTLPAPAWNDELWSCAEGLPTARNCGLRAKGFGGPFWAAGTGGRPQGMTKTAF